MGRGRGEEGREKGGREGGRREEAKREKVGEGSRQAWRENEREGEGEGGWREEGDLNGEDPWNNGDIDPHSTTVVVELDECFCSEEELCDDEVCPCIHLLLEVLDVLFITGAVRVTMGVACRDV